ncbi:hypothetical protein B5F86_11910 [Lachnoclostridium sp. An298]|nr:hypothetical protein B5F86_11910 [Lachnoclostridium sp. An298]
MKRLTLGDVCKKASSNIAQKDLQDKIGAYPIYGASGLIKQVDFYQQDKEYIAVVKDGAGIGRTMLLPAYSSVIGTMQYLLPKEGIPIDIKYLFYAVEHMNLAKYFSGATIPHIYFKDYQKEPINIPDIDTQRKISRIFDKIDALITSRKEQRTKLDQIVKSRFIEMFGNFVYERDRWNVCTIGDVADTIDPQPSHRTPPISLDGIPYVGIAECNYSTRRIDFEKARKVGQNVLREHTERYTLDEGDFIIGKIGTIGKPFFIPIEQTYTLSANTVLIKPIKGKVVSQYLYAVFQSEYMDRIIDAEKKSTSQPAFGIQKVRRIEIPMPPLELQQQFAAFVAQTDKSKLAIQKSLDKLEILKKALMQKYFG